MVGRLSDLGDQTIALDLGPTVVEFKVSTSYSDYRSFFDQQFDAADADDNDYIDKGESDRNGLISNLFAAADRDADGKLFKPELMTYLDRIDDAVSSRVALAVSDRGRSVFQAIDPSDDLRLSPRERLGLPERLAAIAPDGRDDLRFDDFPRRYRLNIGLGPDNAGPQVVFVGGQVAVPAAAGSTGGAPPGSPRWTATATATSPSASSSAPSPPSTASTPTATASSPPPRPTAAAATERARPGGSPRS